VNDERTRTNPRRVANADLVRATVSQWTMSHTTAEIVAAIGGKVPVGPVNTAREIFNDPHVKQRAMLVEIEQPGDNPSLTIAGCPIKFTNTQSGIYRRPPLLGEHTNEVLAEIGLTIESREKS
jgi:crotonobetainyl-CoA:carnitine CoA-transferase CaiB-like acyl-CoA transferase